MAQSIIEFPTPDLPIDTIVFCAAQAEAIRVLGRRMARDIVEIGQRLIVVQKKLGYGGFTKWLTNEFDWGQSTAYEFMRIAEAFDSFPITGEVSISLNALSLLSDPNVPQEIRSEAIEKAEDGERITLAEAKKLIAGEVADKIAELRAEAQRQRDAAVASATSALRDELNRLREVERQEPTVEDVIAIMQRISGKKRLSRTQTEAIAMLTGYAVPYKGEMIPPVSRATARAAESKLEVTSSFIRAIEFFGQAGMSVEEVFEASMPFQRTIARAAIPLVMDWLAAYEELLQREDK